MDRSHPVRFERAARLRQSRGRTTVLVLSRPSRVEHAARLRQSRSRPTVLVLSRPSRVERAAHHHSSCQCFYRLLSEAISESRLASKFCMLLNVVILGGGRMGCRGGRTCAMGCYGDFTKHGLFAARGTKFCATLFAVHKIVCTGNSCRLLPRLCLARAPTLPPCTRARCSRRARHARCSRRACMRATNDANTRLHVKSWM